MLKRKAGSQADLPSSWRGKNRVEWARFFLRQQRYWLDCWQCSLERSCQEWLFPSRHSFMGGGTECFYPTAPDYQQWSLLFGGNCLVLSSPHWKHEECFLGEYWTAWEHVDENCQTSLSFSMKTVILNGTSKSPCKERETNSYNSLVWTRPCILALTHGLGVFLIKTYLLWYIWISLNLLFFSNDPGLSQKIFLLDCEVDIFLGFLPNKPFNVKTGNDTRS